MKKKIITIFQILFGLGLIFFLFYRMHEQGRLNEIWFSFKKASSNFHFIFYAFSCFLACMLICMQRWNILLRAQNIFIPFPKIFALFFIGHFFNSFMPGATTGDILKAYYVAKSTPGKKTESVSTIVLDRLIGLIVLILLTIIIMFIRLNFFLSYTETKIAFIFNIALFGGTILFFVIILSQNFLERFAIFRKLTSKTDFGQIIKRVYTAFSVSFCSPKIMISTGILSLINHICFIAVTFFVGKALGIPLSFWNYLTIFPIINAIAAMPITPGGLGARETATVFLMGTFGVSEPSALSLSLLSYTTVLMWSLIGGIVYIFFIIIEGKPQPL